MRKAGENTDAGIVGVGPYGGADPALVGRIVPFQVSAFWEAHLSGRRAGTSGKKAVGFEIAMFTHPISVQDDGTLEMPHTPRLGIN